MPLKAKNDCIFKHLGLRKVTNSTETNLEKLDAHYDATKGRREAKAACAIDAAT